MKTILVDPFPREMKLIFTSEKLQLLKKNYQLINVPNKNKKKFYEQNIAKADFIIGQDSSSSACNSLHLAAPVIEQDAPLLVRKMLAGFKSLCITR